MYKIKSRKKMINGIRRPETQRQGSVKSGSSI